MKSFPHDFISNVHMHGLNPRSREIFLHGHFDTDNEEPGVDYRMASTFIKNIILLNRQNTTSPIYIHMNSIGGEWNDGMAIYDAIVASVAPVCIIAYAHARSMTSIIFQAADLRLMSPSADFMIHYGSFSIDDTTLGTLSAAEWMNYSNKVMLDVYANRCKDGEYFKRYKKYNEDPDAIKSFLDRKMKDKQEWYLTSKEAVEYGFADGVLGREFSLDDILKNNIEIEKTEWKI